jgi:hypothetical protein
MHSRGRLANTPFEGSHRYDHLWSFTRALSGLNLPAC